MEHGERSSRSTVVVAGDDLLFSDRIAARLAQLGYRPVIVRTADAFHEAVLQGPAAAILNLASYRLDAPAAIRRAKADPRARGVPLLGFCGHADEARQAAARGAGCDLVTTNGAVAARLDRLLASLRQASRRRPTAVDVKRVAPADGGPACDHRHRNEAKRSWS